MEANFEYSRIRKEITPQTLTLSFPAPTHNALSLIRSGRPPPFVIDVFLVDQETYRDYRFRAGQNMIAEKPRGY